MAGEGEEGKDLSGELESHCDIMLRSVPLSIGLATKDGRILKFNDAMSRMMGYSMEELEKVNLADTYQDPTERASLLELLRRDGRVQDFEAHLKRKDGTPYCARLSINPISLDGTDLFLTVAEDITEQNQMEEDLRKSEKRYKQLWDNAPVAYHTLDTNGIITSVNKTETEMLGYDAEEMLGKPIFEYVLPEQREEARKRFQLKITGVPVPKANNRIYVAKDGSQVFVSIDDVLQRDDEDRIGGICTTMIDVSEHHKAEETIRDLAYHDAVTKLPNRTFFGMRLATALTRAHEAKGGLAMMVLDIDHFKRVNDTLGHNVADGVLRIIGQRLSRLVRDGDTVARMGGDEFLVLLPETAEKKGASETAQRILKAVEEPIVYAGHELHVSVSIGVSLYPDDGEGNDELIKNADVAMYHVKQNGRNGCRFYAPDMGISQETVKHSSGGILKWIAHLGSAKGNPEQNPNASQETLRGSILALSSIAEKLEPNTASHQQRTAWLACAIAEEMGLSGDEIEGIRAAGTLHDIGKIIVPADILNKPGLLSRDEMDLIKTHPQVGHEILGTIDFPWPVAEITLQHQERMDGSGYPAGLSGEEIFQAARILCVADVVEAMSSDRPYRPALSMDRSLEEISQKKGVLYDPDAVDACLALFRKKGLRFPT